MPGPRRTPGPRHPGRRRRGALRTRAGSHRGATCTRCGPADTLIRLSPTLHGHSGLRRPVPTARDGRCPWSADAHSGESVRRTALGSSCHDSIGSEGRLLGHLNSADPVDSGAPGARRNVAQASGWPRGGRPLEGWRRMPLLRLILRRTSPSVRGTPSIDERMVGAEKLQAATRLALCGVNISDPSDHLRFTPVSVSIRDSELIHADHLQMRLLSDAGIPSRSPIRLRWKCDEEVCERALSRWL